MGFKLSKNIIFQQHTFPPFCFMSQRLNGHVSVIYQMKGIFVLYNIGEGLLCRKMQGRGPKVVKMHQLGGHLEKWLPRSSRDFLRMAPTSK